MLMMTNSSDKKLTSVFRSLLKGPAAGAHREKAARDFREVRTRVVAGDLGQTLDGLFARLSAPTAERVQPDAPGGFKIIGALREGGFVEASACLFHLWREVMGAQKLEDVLGVAPHAASIEVWRQAARVPKKEVEARLLADPAKCYATAGADWLMIHAKPERALPMLELVLNRKERPKTLPTWADALGPALRKDKRGAVLEAILRHRWADHGPVAILGEAVRLNRALLKSTVEHLPTLLCKPDAPDTGVSLVEALFAPLHSTQGAERELVTAALARLGCGILLQDRRGPQAEAVLALIALAARRLRNLTTDEGHQARTWVLENLSPGSEPAPGKAQVTLDGARQLGVAFEKAAQGFSAKDILGVTARNLGLTPVGAKGETVSYNALKHEDLEGGVLPGDNALIEEPGWALGQDVVMRAKVRKGASHV
jgi:hypothetical protein